MATGKTDADVVKNVATVFSVVNQTGSALSQIASTFSNLGSKMLKVVGLAGAVSSALGAIGAGVSFAKIAEVGTSFEQMRLQIGGFIDALDISGDFNSGLILADQTIQKILVAAAALPGEAEDYIEVFRAGLPFVQNAVGGTLKNMTDFTNRYTAIASSFKIESQQAGRDLRLMLNLERGRAGARVKTFMSMLPYMRKLEGQADLSARAFNDMTAPERAKLLLATFEKFDPLLKAQADSWEAIVGASKTLVRLMQKTAGADLFKSMKDSLKRINELFMDAAGNFTPTAKSVIFIGKLISHYIGKALDYVVILITMAAEALKRFVSSPAFLELVTFIDKLINGIGKLAGAIFGGEKKELKHGARGAAHGRTQSNVATAVAGGAGATAAIGTMFGSVAIVGALGQGIAAIIGAVASGIATLFGQVELLPLIAGVVPVVGAQISLMLTPIALVFSTVIGGLVGGFINFLTRIREADGLMTAIYTVIEMLSGGFTGVISVIDIVTTAFGDIFVGVIVSVVKWIGVFIAIVIKIWQTLANLVAYLNTNLIPALKELWISLGKLATALADTLMPAITKFVGFLLAVGVSFVKRIEPVISTLIYVFTALADAITWVLTRIGGPIKAVGISGAQAPPKFVLSAMADLEKFIKEMEALLSGGKTDPSGKRVNANTVQDFRYSRFDITQKFAEGFDPDRIALAFASDLGKLGDQKHQSGMDPLFGGGRW